MQLKTTYKLVPILLFSLMGFYSNAQTGKFKSFKLVIIAPDTAIIEPGLKQYIDTLQNDHIKGYYASMKRMEEMINFKDYPKDEAKRFEATIKKEKIQLKKAKEMENEVKKFKYYQTISEYTCEVLNFYFNEYPPLSTFQVVKTQSTAIKDLSRLADSLKADYIVCYHNIHTQSVNNEIILKLTTVLYSNSTHAILLEKETDGNTSSLGDMWTCTNPLSCLLITGIKSSTDLVAPELAKRQHK